MQGDPDAHPVHRTWIVPDHAHIPTVSLKLTIIIGSTRPGRVGPTVAHWVDQFARDHGKFQSSSSIWLTSPCRFSTNRLTRGYSNTNTNIRDAECARGIVRCLRVRDARIRLFPPATLVNAIQFLMKEWAEKPAAIVSYGGISGGFVPRSSSVC